LQPMLSPRMGGDPRMVDGEHRETSRGRALRDDDPPAKTTTLLSRLAVSSSNSSNSNNNSSNSRLRRSGGQRWSTILRRAGGRITFRATVMMEFLARRVNLDKIHGEEECAFSSLADKIVLSRSYCSHPFTVVVISWYSFITRPSLSVS